MKTIIPLYAPPNSREWNKLFDALSVDGAPKKATVIINPAGGPGPAGKWEERKHWLGLMARLGRMGVRLALYVAAQTAQPNGRRLVLGRRSPGDLTTDIAVWRLDYLQHLPESTPVAWWIDQHPCSMERMAWPEIVSLYKMLKGEDIIANCRTVPVPEVARTCAAGTICVHDGNNWPPMTLPSLGGKRTAIMVCETPGLIPNAKRTAEYLYAVPASWSAGVYQTVSPLLARILELNAA